MIYFVIEPTSHKTDVSSKRRTPAAILEVVKQVAIEQGGRCTTRKLSGSKDSVSLVCSKGHKWQSLPHDIIGSRRTWCRQCKYDNLSSTLRLDLETVQSHALEQGGKCLSRAYTNAHQKLDFECAAGHRWQATWSNVSSGKWCPNCRRREAAESRRLGIDAARSLAKQRRGKCLSDEYIHNRTPLTWRCHRGHEWKAGLDSIKAGAWCPQCARIKLSQSRKGRPPPLRRKIELSDLKAFARKHRGRVLTDFYVNQRQIIDWECKRGHRFRLSFVNIQYRENFCSICSEEQRKLELLKAAHRFARSNRGRCLSDIYKSVRAPMKWQCRAGHKFTDTWLNVRKREHFCLRCN